MEQGITNVSSVSGMLPFISIIITVITFIIGLDCIWRVERRLDNYMKLITTAIGLTAVRKVVGLLGFSQAPNWTTILLYFDIAIGVVFFFAFLRMYQIIRYINRESR